MNDAPMIVTLTVREEGGAWLADLVFSNRGAGPSPLYRPNVPVSGKIANNVFVITVDGQRVRYRGPYLKRRAPAAEDFIVVAPGEELRFEASLSAAYDIPDAPGQRRARYEAYHGDVKLWGGIWKLRSEEVVF